MDLSTDQIIAIKVIASAIIILYYASFLVCFINDELQFIDIYTRREFFLAFIPLFIPVKKFYYKTKRTYKRLK